MSGKGNSGASYSALPAPASIAQLVERLVYTEDVGGSSPSGSTLQINTP